MSSTARALSGRNRQEAWRDRLQAFASKQPEEMGDEWGQLLKELGLTNGYYLAVSEVLKQGRWKTAKYPRAYVKKVAAIEARKMRLIETPENDTLEFYDRNLRFVGSFDDADEKTPPAQFKANRLAERAQWENEARYEAESNARMREEQAAESGPFWPSDCLTSQTLLAKNPDGSIDRMIWNRRDWQKLGEKAGLDQGEVRVLQYKVDGISREQAAEQQGSEVSRKAIQASWKRFDRTGKKRKSGIERLQLFLRKTVPDELHQDTRELESSALPDPKAAISGNPLHGAWKQTGGTSREDLGRFLIKYRGRAPHLWGSGVKILDSKCPG